MTGRISLVEQKKLQWIQEREELAKLNDYWSYNKSTFSPYLLTRSKVPSKEQSSKKKALGGHYGSFTSLKSLDYSTTGDSIINIVDQSEVIESRRKRSPSLPPIYSKENHQTFITTRDSPNLEVEGSRYTNYPRVQKHLQREMNRNIQIRNSFEEREGETSGYASDSVEIPLNRSSDNVKRLVPIEKTLEDSDMSDRNWQSNYCETPDTSLPPSRKFSNPRLGELNRPRWGNLWDPDDNLKKNPPPPPSWLERNLSRIDNHSSQVLIINHENASSPDSSTTGSTGSESKTYLRGQNIPVDNEILLERETRRQKALELQNAIKQQLEEKDRRRKEERERKIKEDYEEEQRIQRERNKERERFEEEQKKLKEKEYAKLKKEEAMREILATAEQAAKEQKKQQQKRLRESIQVKKSHDDIHYTNNDINKVNNDKNIEFNNDKNNNIEELEEINKTDVNNVNYDRINIIESNINNKCDVAVDTNLIDDNEDVIINSNKKLPMNKEIAIVLTGRIEDPEMLIGKNFQLLNLVFNNTDTLINNKERLNSPLLFENRLLTPSKYRAPNGRDFGTQTDGEYQDVESKDIIMNKEKKNIFNKKDEKSTNTTSMDEKHLVKCKGSSRQTLESRPRWNANRRPGTRYRTQSEKDPHYQKRLRMRRRRIESSDERSRSPSPPPDRMKSINIKSSKMKNSMNCKSKLNISMDNLNSMVPLKIDENGYINLKNNIIKNSTIIEYSSSKCDERQVESKNKSDVWCEQDILTQLASLKNGLLLKQREWDSEICLVSPTNDDFY